MSPKLGQKLTDNPKNVQLNLRLTKQEAEDIQYCADKLHTTRVDVVNRGVRKVKEEIDKTHTVTVPNLKGMSVDNAKYTLEMSGLNFEIVGAGHSEVSSAYAVNQSIAAGEEVTPATVIGVEFRQVTSD